MNKMNKMNKMKFFILFINLNVFYFNISFTSEHIKKLSNIFSKISCLNKIFNFYDKNKVEKVEKNLNKAKEKVEQAETFYQKHKTGIKVACGSLITLYLGKKSYNFFKKKNLNEIFSNQIKSLQKTVNMHSIILALMAGGGGAIFKNESHNLKKFIEKQNEINEKQKEESNKQKKSLEEQIKNFEKQLYNQQDKIINIEQKQIQEKEQNNNNIDNNNQKKEIENLQIVQQAQKIQINNLENNQNILKENQINNNNNINNLQNEQKIQNNNYLKQQNEINEIKDKQNELDLLINKNIQLNNLLKDEIFKIETNSLNKQNEDFDKLGIYFTELIKNIIQENTININNELSKNDKKVLNIDEKLSQFDEKLSKNINLFTETNKFNQDYMVNTLDGLNNKYEKNILPIYNDLVLKVKYLEENNIENKFKNQDYLNLKTTLDNQLLLLNNNLKFIFENEIKLSNNQKKIEQSQNDVIKKHDKVILSNVFTNVKVSLDLLDLSNIQNRLLNLNKILNPNDICFICGKNHLYPGQNNYCSKF